VSKFISKDEELFLKVVGDVIAYPQRYLEAGKWLDRYYDSNELLTEKRREIKKQKRQLNEEIEEIKGKIKTEELTGHTKFNEKLQHLEGDLFTKSRRLEFISQFETEQRPSIKERLAYALEDLFQNYQQAGVLSEQDARAVLLIVWVATDAKTNETKLSITKFANIHWETKAEVSDESRFGLAPFLFLELDIALHYEYSYKPEGGSDYGPIYELDLNYLRMIHRAWAKIKAEEESELANANKAIDDFLEKLKPIDGIEYLHNKDKTDKPKTLSNRLKDYAEYFRELPHNMLLEVLWERYYKTEYPIGPLPMKIMCAGGNIRELLRFGCFKKDKDELLDVYNEGRKISMEKGNTRIWQEMSRNLRARALLSYNCNYFKTFDEDCQLVANELEKEVQALVAKEKTEPKKQTNGDKKVELYTGENSNGKTRKTRHSLDFRSVSWFGTDYTFTPNQAAAVKILWENWENGTPEVGGDTLATEVESESKRARDIFKNHLAFGSMIQKGKTKGTYRLVEPDK
jgi:hypothetical protein